MLWSRRSGTSSKSGGDDEHGGSSRSRVGIVLAVVAIAVVVEADVAWAQAGGIAEVQRFASRLTNYVTAVAASIAILFIAVNGVRWTMSSGNPARQAEAKNGLVAAGAGLAIALSANLVVNLVVAALR
jgi:hypothetical protein